MASRPAFCMMMISTGVRNKPLSVEQHSRSMRNNNSSKNGPAKLTNDFVTAAATIAVVAVGAALFEVALIPSIAIGGAAVLGPKYLRKLRRHPRMVVARPGQPEVMVAPVAREGFAIKQALAKTITFQIVVTTVDFTAHFVLVGNLATAASLSASHLIVRPLFYFVHETAWNYLSPPVKRKVGLKNNRAVVKTVTYQTIASALDFTTHYVVVGNLATAAALSAVGFVVSPFVYFGHEIAWDYYGSPGRRRALPIPGRSKTRVSSP
jgi:uncharacterized membrane protein